MDIFQVINIFVRTNKVLFMIFLVIAKYYCTEDICPFHKGAGLSITVNKTKKLTEIPQITKPLLFLCLSSASLDVDTAACPLRWWITAHAVHTPSVWSLCLCNLKAVFSDTPAGITSLSFPVTSQRHGRLCPHGWPAVTHLFGKPSRHFTRITIKNVTVRNGSYTVTSQFFYSRYLRHCDRSNHW